MKSWFSGITSTLTRLQPLLLMAGTAAVGAGAYYLLSRCSDEEQTNSTAENSAQTQVEGRHWRKKYRMRRLLGIGGFGSVYAGERKEDRMPVAIKFVSKRRAMKEIQTPQGVLPREVALMQMLNSTPCSNVIQLLDWFDEPSRYVLILERPRACQDVDAFCRENGGFLNEGLAKTVMAQLIKALIHCRNCGVFHRDVKPENLLIQTRTNEVKLIDFGAGDMHHSLAYMKFAGTRNYTPPEWFQRRQYWADPTTVWSVGVTLFKMMHGVVPFTSTQEIINGRVVFSKVLSPECCDLINWCLKPNPEDRPTLNQIQLHPWFQNQEASGVGPSATSSYCQ